jgi:hypothetical protein
MQATAPEDERAQAWERPATTSTATKPDGRGMSVAV